MHDLKHQANILYGVGVMSLFLGPFGARADYKRIKRQVVNEFKDPTNQIVEDLKEQEDYVRNKLNRFEQLENKTDKIFKKIEALKTTLGQIENARIEAHEVQCEERNKIQTQNELLKQQIELYKVCKQINTNQNLEQFKELLNYCRGIQTIKKERPNKFKNYLDKIK